MFSFFLSDAMYEYGNGERNEKLMKPDECMCMNNYEELEPENHMQMQFICKYIIAFSRQGIAGKAFNLQLDSFFYCG